MKTGIIKNNKGSALVYVMFALVLLMLMISITVTITMGNTRQASEQETGMQAYYIARSGVEASYESLLSTSPSLLTDPGPDSFKTDSSMVLNDSIDFGDGIAEITVTSSGAGDTQKIKIHSVGTVRNVSRSVALEFYLNYDKYPDMVWSR